MIKFCSLSSGSSGNCYYIGTETTHLLLDAGISGARTEKALNEIGESCTKIDAILITHEHEDHIHSAGVLSRRYDIPVYATEGTWQGMSLCKICEHNVRVIEAGQEYFTLGDICVKPFAIPHDAREPVAYSFVSGESKISVATDIGHMTDTIRKSISGSEMILLESNYDENRLKYGSYPKSLQKRISGMEGHLSNENASEVVVEMAKEGTRTFLLGHLSHENNTPTLAYETVNRKLTENGFTTGKDVFMYVAKRDMPGRLLTF